MRNREPFRLLTQPHHRVKGERGSRLAPGTPLSYSPKPPDRLSGARWGFGSPQERSRDYGASGGRSPRQHGALGPCERHLFILGGCGGFGVLQRGQSQNDLAGFGIHRNVQLIAGFRTKLGKVTTPDDRAARLGNRGDVSEAATGFAAAGSLAADLDARGSFNDRFVHRAVAERLGAVLFGFDVARGPSKLVLADVPKLFDLVEQRLTSEGHKAVVKQLANHSPARSQVQASLSKQGDLLTSRNRLRFRVATRDGETKAVKGSRLNGLQPSFWQSVASGQ